MSKNDGGYGVTGNVSMNILLKLLPTEHRQKYEEYLKKEDLQSYKEYKEWSDNINGFTNTTDL